MTTVRVNYRVSYGINSFLTQQFADPAAARSGSSYELSDEVRQTSQVHRASSIVLHTESGNDNVWREDQLRWDFDREVDPGNGPERIEVHHKTGNNFTFADAHIEYVRITKNTNDVQCGVPKFPFKWVPLKNLQVRSTTGGRRQR